MAIIYDELHRVFRLDAGDSTYAMQLSPQGYLFHLYYGKHVSDTDLGHLLESGGGASFSANPAAAPELSLDTSLQEYPGAGVGDYRVPALALREANGAAAVCLRYRSHEIFSGKPVLPGLPATYCNTPDEAQTLAVTLEDPLLGLSATLYYCAFAQLNILTRWTVLRNEGGQILRLQSVQSACVEFPDHDFDMISFHGAHNRERDLERHPLFFGTSAIQSRRGSSGHQLNPFAILCEPSVTESQGEAYGCNLVYSGNFCMEAEVSQMGSTRWTAGINSFDFEWVLRPGTDFVTPEAVLAYSDGGLGGLSRAYHRLYRTHLCRGAWRDISRPILINNWEATYFDFDADKLVAIAHEAAKADVDLLVMDDGWFGDRYDDRRGLGDWGVNETKLGCPLGVLVERVQAEGLQFGIWFEPEMISPDSDLARAHPDWCLHVPGRDRSLGRTQSVLNLLLPEVRDNIFAQLSAALESADIRYVKWDFNRNLTEVYSASLPPAQGREAAHRYVLGLYELLERLTQKFPEVLFESCSGGGGRFDPGMLYYMPQTWCSDNTDAVDRLRIQYGTSMCYPISSMGSHVAAVGPPPCRWTSLRFRADVAMAGTFGYELDLTKLPAAQITEMKHINAQFRAWQPLIAGGDFYRLISPFEQSAAAWMFVAPDQSEALAQYFLIHKDRNAWPPRLRLQGLDPAAHYEIEDWGLTLCGDTLMHAGVRLPLWQGRDYQSWSIYLHRVDQ
ncbi:MAG: alpha-galactosidase [Oscillospiraceae bacterium]|jgi:alpha-galactosidase|nr:alpha-galactosidase [Oscillospiraceae bacterium]